LRQIQRSVQREIETGNRGLIEEDSPTCFNRFQWSDVKKTASKVTALPRPLIDKCESTLLGFLPPKLHILAPPNLPKTFYSLLNSAENKNFFSKWGCLPTSASVYRPTKPVLVPPW
jgi:hypothetical protein